MATDLIQHAFHGQAVRVITDEHGDPWFVAGDVCDYFGVSNRNRVMQAVDPEDKGGTRIATPGGAQIVTTITESGLYALLFALQPQQARGVDDEYVAARLEKVREFKRWVTHEVLPSIRRTGSYAIPQTPEQRIAAALIEASALLAERDERIAELEPPARAWTALADATGDYSLRDAAQILDRDPDIRTGQNRLGQYLRQIGWLDKRGIPYQRAVEVGYVRSRVRTYSHPRTGEQMVGEPQVRVTGKGLTWLHKHLGGTEPLDVTERHLEVVS